MDIDVTHLKFGELDALRGRIDERIREMRDTEGPALRERFAEEAAALGLTLEELIGTNGKRRGRPTRGEEAEGRPWRRSIASTR